MHLLEIKNLSFQLGGKMILDDLNLTIAHGEIHALIGTNGSGKSSVAYLILGCEKYVPTSGEILFEGNSINALKLFERARLGIALSWLEPARLDSKGSQLRTISVSETPPLTLEVSIKSNSKP